MENRSKHFWEQLKIGLLACGIFVPFVYIIIYLFYWLVTLEFMPVSEFTSMDWKHIIRGTIVFWLFTPLFIAIKEYVNYKK